MIDTATEVLSILNVGRTAKTEWFKASAPTDKLALSMAAMANTYGGALLLGIGPTGRIEGVDDVERAIDRVLEAAFQLEPRLFVPMPRSLWIDGKTVLLARIPPGMPNVYSVGGRYLRRDGAQNVGMNPSELRRLMIERGVTSFESEVLLGATLDDINWEMARDYAQLFGAAGRRDVQRVLERRGCLVLYTDTLLPTHAGILLFGTDPQRFIRGSEITAARFAGDNMGDIFNREDITGTLPEQIRRAETFLADHLRKGVELGSTMARKEQREYPLEAAREIVVNAVSHRDYSITGDGVRLFIFRDRMEVTSPGGLAGHVTVDNIKDERFSRNPVIVQVLADMGFIERLGYGVDRVIDLMRSQNLREPEFRETDGGFRVTLYRKGEIVRHLTDSGVFDAEMELNPRQEVAIEFLKTNDTHRITNSDLQSLCPDVHAETLRRDLADLVTKGVLVKKGQKRGSYYVLSKEFA